MDDEEAGSVGQVDRGVGSVATAAGEGGAGEGTANEGVSLFGSEAERVAENWAAEAAMAEEGGTPGGTGVRGVPCGAPRGAGGAGTGKTTLTPREVPAGEDRPDCWDRLLASSVPMSPSSTGVIVANPSKFLSSARGGRWRGGTREK